MPLKYSMDINWFIVGLRHVIPSLKSSYEGISGATLQPICIVQVGLIQSLLNTIV